MKRITLVLLIICAMTMCLDVHAAPVTRYTTQKTELKANGKVIHTVKRGTKVKRLRVGKKWSTVKYKGKRLKVRRRHLTKYKPLKKKVFRALFQKGRCDPLEP